MEAGQPVIDSKKSSNYIGTADFETRYDATKKLAEMVGLRMPKEFVKPGEALLEIGEENKQKMDAEVEALPNFRDGSGMLRERIRAEDAKDFKGTPIQRISMVATEGRPVLTWGDGDMENMTRTGYTRTGFGHLTDAIKPKGLIGLSSNLLAIRDPDLRSKVFNHHAERAFERNQLPVTLRTIVEPASGLRVLRAVVSGQHSAASGDDLAILNAMDAQLADSLDKAKLRVTRNLERSYMELLWPAMKRQTKVGDIVLIGVRVRNSETKQGALKVEPFVLDTLCYNFTTAESTGGDEEVVIRHVGDLGPKLAQVFMRCLKKVDPFIKAFGDAYAAPLPMTRGEILQRVASVFELPDPTIKAAAAAWDSQAQLHSSPGESLADLVNALTKASQDENMDEAMVTGRAAGTLVERGFAALEA